MYDVRPISAEIFVDASLTGLGGAFGNLVYTLSMPKNHNNYSIVNLKIFNVMVALKIWGHLWKDKHIHIHCDNHFIVDTLNSDKASDDILATCIGNIWLLTV